MRSRCGSARKLQIEPEKAEFDLALILQRCYFLPPLPSSRTVRTSFFVFLPKTLTHSLHNGDKKPSNAVYVAHLAHFLARPPNQTGITKIPIGTAPHIRYVASLRISFRFPFPQLFTRTRNNGVDVRKYQSRPALPFPLFPIFLFYSLLRHRSCRSNRALAHICCHTAIGG